MGTKIVPTLQKNFYMHGICIGAGPAGLLFALLHKRRFPKNTVEVIEQNEAGSAFGFGVVFSQGALVFSSVTRQICMRGCYRAWNPGRCNASCIAI